MRSRHWLVGVAATGALSGFFFGGCGGTATEVPTDGGRGDATTLADAARDTAVGPADTGASKDAGAPCQSDADLVNSPYLDASLGEGGSTVAACTTCVRTTCATDLAACQAECECRRDIASVFACLAADGGALLACATPIFSSTATKAQPLGVCVVGGCQAACATGPIDSGIRDASDGG